MKASHHPLYHRFLTQLKNYKIQNKKILIACSGGLDSVCLVDLMVEVSRILKLEIMVVHVHHGELKNSLKNNSFRSLAQMYTHSLALGLDLPFLTQTYDQKNPLQSEEDFRRYRYQILNQWMKQTKSHFLALAHTSSDLLETRLMRLVRGTGEKGLLSMKYLHEKKLRPLLFATKEEIKHYASFRKIKPIEDPSNKQTQYLRNWIRLKWLKEIEQHSPRSLENLSRSLERISLAIENTQPNFLHLQDSKGILKKEFLKLSKPHQKQFLIQKIQSLNIKNYTEAQVEEILKFIHKNNKNSHLKIMNQYWSLSQNYIKMKTLLGPSKKCYTRKRGLI